MDGATAWQHHAARQHLARRLDGDAPTWARRQRHPTTRMPDIALGTPAARSALAASVTARLRAARGGA